LTQILPGLKKKVKMIYTPLIEVSSSAIRARIAEGLPYRYYLPPVVYSLIQQQALYR
jgi:nicotinic acid mononucleotide adenylyltransferase